MTCTNCFIGCGGLNAKILPNDYNFASFLCFAIMLNVYVQHSNLPLAESGGAACFWHYVFPFDAIHLTFLSSIIFHLVNLSAPAGHRQHRLSRKDSSGEPQVSFRDSQHACLVPSLSVLASCKPGMQGPLHFTSPARRAPLRKKFLVSREDERQS